MTEAVLTASGRPGSIYLKLPATSANLGPGFDALGLAMSFYLSIDAVVSPDGLFAIEATGRDAELCGRLDGNLILDTYRDVVRNAGGEPLALHLLLHNEIPLGMGCGSSAAALLTGVLLANHFGGLGMTGYQAMEEACRREGHPDNVAACWLGGMTTSAPKIPGNGSEFVAASFAASKEWGLMLAIPSAGLATTKARALLPESYSKADAVLNVQHAALIVAAFALGRGDLLRTAMADRMHQPYRMEACPLLPLLLPLAGEPGVLGVSLSGAGPSVLVIHERAVGSEVRSAIARAAGQVELIEANTTQGTIISVT
ncbi:homoserine kinase [Granulicella aggregans]|uniref:Homoserine kinase n=1 Tax=Granulicella aggregans TaxID=474949 RepID=A0A7W7ZHH0_9BACT|nr:homoserine kinase [Granulicella aggregans]MBB5060000.1 homoserine kinase [Granulicella aggregans]